MKKTPNERTISQIEVADFFKNKERVHKVKQGLEVTVIFKDVKGKKWTERRKTKFINRFMEAKLLEKI